MRSNRAARAAAGRFVPRRPAEVSLPVAENKKNQPVSQFLWNNAAPLRRSPRNKAAIRTVCSKLQRKKGLVQRTACNTLIIVGCWETVHKNNSSGGQQQQKQRLKAPVRGKFRTLTWCYRAKVNQCCRSAVYANRKIEAILSSTSKEKKTS